MKKIHRLLLAGTIMSAVVSLPEAQAGFANGDAAKSPEGVTPGRVELAQAAEPEKPGAVPPAKPPAAAPPPKPAPPAAPPPAAARPAPPPPAAARPPEHAPPPPAARPAPPPAAAR